MNDGGGGMNPHRLDEWHVTIRGSKGDTRLNLRVHVCAAAIGNQSVDVNERNLDSSTCHIMLQTEGKENPNNKKDGTNDAFCSFWPSDLLYDRDLGRSGKIVVDTRLSPRERLVLRLNAYCKHIKERLFNKYTTNRTFAFAPAPPTP